MVRLFSFFKRLKKNSNSAPCGHARLLFHWLIPFEPQYTSFSQQGHIWKHKFHKTYSVWSLFVQLILLSRKKTKIFKQKKVASVHWQKKIFFLTLLDSVNFLQKYFENFRQNFWLKFCVTLYHKKNSHCFNQMYICFVVS